MRKVLLALSLALLLAAPGAMAAQTAEDNAAATNPVDQFTGKYWVETQPTSKEAYLFGLESAIDVEKLVNTRLRERAGKKSPLPLSPFVKGWITAFNDVPRREIREEIDKWYAAHPDELNRPVLNVIWFELIEPRLKAAK